MFLLLYPEQPVASNVHAQLVEKKDPINDSLSVIAIVPGDSKSIAIGCRDSRTGHLSVVVSIPESLGYSDANSLAGGMVVDYRFDQRSPVTSRWSTTGSSVVSRNDDVHAVRFMAEMKHSTSLYLRVHPSTEPWIDADFSYADPTPVLNAMLGKCGLDQDGKRLKGGSGAAGG